MIDPITWGANQLTNDSLCHDDFKLFVTVIRMMNSENYHNLNADTRLYLEFPQVTMTGMRMYSHKVTDNDKTGEKLPWMKSSRNHRATIYFGWATNSHYTEKSRFVAVRKGCVTSDSKGSGASVGFGYMSKSNHCQIGGPVFNLPDLSTQVKYNFKLPTRMNWAGCQRAAQSVHLWIYIRLSFCSLSIPS